MKKFNKYILNSFGYDVVDNSDKETEKLIDKKNHIILCPRHTRYYVNIEDRDDFGEPAIAFYSDKSPDIGQIILLNENQMIMYPNAKSRITTNYDNGKFVYKITTFYDNHEKKNKISIFINTADLCISVLGNPGSIFNLNQYSTYAKVDNKRMINAMDCNVENYYEMLINRITKYDNGALLKDEEFNKCLDIIKKSLAYTINYFLNEWIKSNDSIINSFQKTIDGYNKQQSEYQKAIASNEANIETCNSSIEYLKAIKEEYQNNKRRK